MKYLKKYLSVAATTLIFSCTGPQKDDKTKAMEHITSKIDSSAAKYTVDMVDNKRDYSCGMPVSAGLEDTCHYKGKAYGFCSKECKEEFLKSPKQYLAEKP
jgi:YHS domain-containing protein